MPAGSVWKFLDDGSDQGTAWREVGFNDSAWRSGPAELGYGDASHSRPEKTLVSYGTNANNKFTTTYFRLAFTVADAAAFADLTLSLLRDDGAVVYLNGREVFRNNLPSGAITFRTSASVNISGAAEYTFCQTTIAATNLTDGLNALAVEIHQYGTTSTDISFDLELVGNRPPITATLSSTADGATPVLNVSLPDVLDTAATVTFYGRPAGPPPGPDFTLVALPDTQAYVNLDSGRPSNFVAQTEWIATNKTALNIAYVAHLGDISEYGDSKGTNLEWLRATNAMYRLEDPARTLATSGIPYGMAVGNHDQKTGTNSLPFTYYYNQYFGVNHFAGRDYYGGHLGTNNNNHYGFFRASGLDFIVIFLEYKDTVTTNMLAWANSLLQTNHDRRGIVVSHCLLKTGNPAPFFSQGQAVYDALKGNSNLFLMLGGHEPGEGRRQDTFNNNTVHTLMADYQSRTNGGNGWLRIIEFSPSNNVIRVKTYTPLGKQYDTNAPSQFTLNYDMRQGGSFTPLAVVEGISTPTNLSVTWPGLAPGTAYEWYVTVSDGTRTTTTPAASFTTASNTPPTDLSDLATAVRPAVVMTTLRIDLYFDRANNSLVLSWPSIPGAVYRVVAKNNITDPGWIDLSEPITADASVVSWSEPLNPFTPTRFYGVRTGQ